MKRFETVAYPICIICALAYGVSMPLVTPLSVPVELTALLDRSGFVMVVAAASCAIASSATMYLVVDAARGQPTIVRLLLKMFVLSLPAVAIGILVSMSLVHVGGFRGTQSLRLLGLSATMYLCAGAAGIAGMDSFSSYDRESKRGRS